MPKAKKQKPRITRRTMTLNLPSQEMDALEEFCEERDVSKTDEVRASLKLHRQLWRRADKGHRIFIVDDEGRKTELIMTQ